MPSINIGEENTVNNINWFTTVNGVLTNMYLVEYAIYNINGGIPGIQIFPASGFEDVTNPPGRFSTGSYYAYNNLESKGWTPQSNLIVGTHRIVWRWKLNSSSVYQYDAEDFELTKQCKTITYPIGGGNRGIPRLLHPIPTYIQSLSVDDTIQDDGYNEPVYNTCYNEYFTIPGQWKWYSEKELNIQRYGLEEVSNGYVLVRTYDLNFIGKNIKIGDRIAGYGTGYNKIDLDVYVTQLRYEGHYQHHGGPSLLKIFFSDKQPKRQTRGL